MPDEELEMERSVFKKVADLVAKASPTALKALNTVCDIADVVPQKHPVLTALRAGCEIKEALTKSRKRKRK